MTSMDFRGLRPKKVWPRWSRWARGAMRRISPACVLTQFGHRVFCGNCKTVAGTYFRGSGACTQCDPKVILGAKTLDAKGDAYHGS